MIIHSQVWSLREVAEIHRVHSDDAATATISPQLGMRCLSNINTNALNVIPVSNFQSLTFVYIVASVITTRPMELGVVVIGTGVGVFVNVVCLRRVIVCDAA